MQQTVIDSFFLFNKKGRAKVDIESTQRRPQRSATCSDLGDFHATSNENIKIRRVYISSKEYEDNTRHEPLDLALHATSRVGTKRKRANDIVELRFATIDDADLQKRKRHCAVPPPPPPQVEEVLQENEPCVQRSAAVSAQHEDASTSFKRVLPARRCRKAVRHLPQWEAAQSWDTSGVGPVSDRNCEDAAWTAEPTNAPREETMRMQKTPDVVSDRKQTTKADATQDGKRQKAWSSTLAPLLSSSAYVEALRNAGGAPEKLVHLAEKAGLIEKGAREFLVNSTTDAATSSRSNDKKTRKAGRGRALGPEKVLERVPDEKISENISHAARDVVGKLRGLVLRTGCHVVFAVRFGSSHMISFSHGNVPMMIRNFCEALKYRSSALPERQSRVVLKHSNVYGRDRCIQHFGTQPMVPYPPKTYKRQGRCGVVRANYEHIGSPDEMHPRDVEIMAPRYTRMIRALHRFLHEQDIRISLEQTSEAHRIMMGDACMEFAPGMYIRNCLSVPLSKRVVDELVSNHADEFGRSMLQELVTPQHTVEPNVELQHWAARCGFETNVGRIVEKAVHTFFAERRCIDTPDHGALSSKLISEDSENAWVEHLPLFAPVRRAARVETCQQRSRNSDSDSDSSSSDESSSDEDESDDEDEDNEDEDGSESDDEEEPRDTRPLQVVFPRAIPPPPLPSTMSDTAPHCVPTAPATADNIASGTSKSGTADTRATADSTGRSLHGKKKRNAPYYRMPAVADAPSLEEMAQQQERAEQEAMRATDDGSMVPCNSDALDLMCEPDEMLKHLRVEHNAREPKTTRELLDSLSDLDMEKHQALLAKMGKDMVAPQQFYNITNDFSECIQQLSNLKKTADDGRAEIQQVLKPLVLHRRITGAPDE